MAEVSEIEAGGEVRTVKDATARQGVAANAAAIEEINEEMAKLLPLGAKLPIVDLGTEYTAELKADIQAGTFKKAVVGGKLTINGHIYYLAHPDYWLHTGLTDLTTHHMLVIPATHIVIGKMNNSNITTGGYIGSDFRTGANSNTALATIIAQIKADFGESNILTHKELFTNAVSGGAASSWDWVDSIVDLMNEVMVYGCNANSSSPRFDTALGKYQIELFRKRADLIVTRTSWWLRSIATSEAFSIVAGQGYAGDGNASGNRGFRPAFAIC